MLNNKVSYAKDYTWLYLFFVIMNVSGQSYNTNAVVANLFFVNSKVFLTNIHLFMYLGNTQPKFIVAIPQKKNFFLIVQSTSFYYP